MASAANNPATAGPSQAQGARHSVRQTRTNPSRTSKLAARSFSFYGKPSTDAPQTPVVPHGFYPALTHFTDSITALPREFRRHNSLLKEVDAKAWALEENLQQLLMIASDSGPVMIRDYAVTQDATQQAESQESNNRRLLFDRIRHTLTDLMMTADEKNHVIANANDELNHQLFRLDSIYPYISGEVSDEARLGSLTHWAYTNRSAAKAATTANERPRREAASANTAHLVQALHEAEVASRSEARREAVMARKQRRNHVESDFDETRPGGARKGAVAKARAAATEHAVIDAVLGAASGTAPAKRRKVEKPQPVQTGTAMERSISNVNNTGRAASKDAVGAEVKKRARAPNPLSAAGRKRNNTVTSNTGSPSAVSSPVVGTFIPPRSAPSPGPNGTGRPQSSKAQQNTNQTSTARQRPPSSASNRVNNNNKPTESKANSNEGSKEVTTQTITADGNIQLEPESNNGDHKAASETIKDGLTEAKVMDNHQTTEPVPPAPPTGYTNTKGRSSKTSTPVVSTFPEFQQSRSRPSRNNIETAPAKRSHKKTGSVSAASYKPKVVSAEDEESSREGDDEDDEGEPRYCYCNEISFGEMVACDNDACPREWFHLSCVGLTKPPGKNVKWYCNECKENMKRGRSAGGR